MSSNRYFNNRKPLAIAAMILVLSPALSFAQESWADGLPKTWQQAQKQAIILLNKAKEESERSLEKAEQSYRDWAGDWPADRRLARPIQYLNHLEGKLEKRLKSLNDAQRILYMAHKRALQREQPNDCIQGQNAKLSKPSQAASIIWNRYNNVQAAQGRIAESKRMIPVWISLIKANNTLQNVQIALGNSELALANTERLVAEPYVVRSPEELFRELDGSAAE